MITRLVACSVLNLTIGCNPWNMERKKKTCHFMATLCVLKIYITVDQIYSQDQMCRYNFAQKGYCKPGYMAGRWQISLATVARKSKAATTSGQFAPAFHHIVIPPNEGILHCQPDF